MAKHCKSYKEFRKILRKYWKRHHRRRNPRDVWNMDWVVYDIMDAETAMAVKKKCEKHGGNLPIFLDEMVGMLGHRVRLDYHDVTGVVIGLEITNCDDYFIVKRDDDGGITYQSCVGHIYVIDQISENE